MVKCNSFSFKIIAVVSILALIYILSLATVMAHTTCKSLISSKWEYLRVVYIKERSGIDLTNYTVRIVLNSTNFDFGKAKSDGSDIRFYDVYGNELNYWIEYWSAEKQYAIVWVRIPVIRANSMEVIHMYYGNPEARPHSNGTSTFVFFDDFVDKLEKDWLFNPGQSGMGRYNIVDGHVEIGFKYVNDPWGRDLWTKAVVFYREVPMELTSYSIEVKFWANTIEINADTYQVGLGVLEEPRYGNGWYIVGFLRDSPEGVSVTHTLCVEGCWNGVCVEDMFAERPITDAQVWLRVDVIEHNGYADFKWYWKQEIYDPWDYRGEFKNKFVPKYVGLWGKTWDRWGATEIVSRTDYILVRKYVDPEPSVILGTEVRVCEIPVVGGALLDMEVVKNTTYKEEAKTFMFITLLMVSLVGIVCLRYLRRK